MNLIDSSVITISADALALIISSVITVLSGCLKKKEHGYRLFAIILFAAMIDAAANGICYALHDKVFANAHLLAMIFQTVLELAIICILYFWLLFVDYMLYGSRDHLIRHYRVHFIPVVICAVLLIINPFTGILYTIDDTMRCSRTIVYDLMLVVEYMYVVISMLVVLKYRRENGRLKFFKPEPMLLPMFTAIVISELTPQSFIALGFALGFLNMYLYMKRFEKYVDKETGFLNPAYLEYIKKLEEKKVRVRDVMIRITGRGDISAMPEILRQELPGDAEVLHMGDGKYLMFAVGKNRGFANLLKSILPEAVEEYREEKGKELSISIDVIRNEDI